MREFDLTDDIQATNPLTDEPLMNEGKVVEKVSHADWIITRMLTEPAFNEKGWEGVEAAIEIKKEALRAKKEKDESGRGVMQLEDTHWNLLNQACEKTKTWGGLNALGAIQYKPFYDAVRQAKKVEKKAG